MKLMAQMAVIGALVTGATALNAQTNIDNNVTVSLSGVVQNGDTSSRGHVATKDVIQALVPGASPKAKLVLRNVLGSGETFVVVDGSTETDVSGSFSTSRAADTAVTVTTTKGSVTTDKTTEIRQFVLSTDTLNFNVQGYTTSTSNNKGLHGETFDDTFPVQATAKVAGTITDTSGNPGVVQGTISVGGRKITETP